MSQIDEQHALQEFLANLQSKDRIKATLVLEHLPGLGQRTRTRMLYELSKSPDRFSLELLFFLAHKSPQLLQAQNGLAQVLQSKAADNPQLTEALLQAEKHPQSRENLQLLNILLAAPGARVRRLARAELLQSGEQALPLLAGNLQSQDKDLILNSLEILSSLGTENALYLVRKLLHAHPEDPNIRFAAYEALSRLPVSKGAYTLAAGLLDPVWNVRLAAARALEQNLEQGLLSGLRNMLQDRQERGSILASLLEARSGQIVLGLLNSLEYRQEIISYLQASHPELRKYYQGLLQEHGLPDLAGQLQETETAAETAAEQGLVICCVDDSGLVLALYRKLLFQLDLQPQLFQSPAQAQQWLLQNPADLVFTDLSMPELSGVELIASLRQRFSSQDMALVAVTAQEEAESRQELLEAGADQILGKPFTLQDLSSCLQAFFPEQFLS
ncbi:MAG: response regulator [Desulfohalobiaceae bacterium]